MANKCIIQINTKLRHNIPNDICCNFLLLLVIIENIKTISKVSTGKKYNFRCRDVVLDSQRKGSLAIVVENSGQRIANDYVLGVQFLQPEVHILNVKTESLTINTLYSLHPEFIKQQPLKDKLADKRIVDAYNDYLHPLLDEQCGDMVFLIGALEGGTYEMFLVEIVIEENIDKFQIRYFVDCSDSWISQQTFFQGFVVRE